MSNKVRLDVLLVDRNLFDSRERAKRFIMSGNVLVNDLRVDKAGALVQSDCTLRLLGNDIPYVSRGGLKLQKALDTFNIALDRRIALDIGASTGGFTDCMLQRHASKVYAIDVGYGQLDWKLRNDPRVVCLERTNIRHVTPNMLPDAPDFASIDVSFISLEKVLPTVFALLLDNSDVVALIKPQFEAGRHLVGKHGVVRDPSVHVEVINHIINSARNVGFNTMGLTFSPIKGPEGNIEYLAHLAKTPSVGNSIDVIRLVDEAHHLLKG